MKIISTDLLIQYFKSLSTHFDSLNNALGLALLCPKIQHSQQLSSTNSLIQIPRESIKTLTSLLGALFSATSALKSPTSSHFALLVWRSWSCQLLEDCTRLELSVVLFPSGASEKLKDQSQTTSLSGCLPLKFRDSSGFVMTVYLWLVYTQNYLKITILLQFVFFCDQEK